MSKAKGDNNKKGSIAQIREFLDAQIDLDSYKGKLTRKKHEKIRSLQKKIARETKETIFLLRRAEELRRALESVNDIIDTNCVHILIYRMEINKILHPK